MSIKSKLLKSNLFKKVIKLGIKLTPKILVSSVANVVLKGIAKFSKISFDLNKRTAYINLTLYGEKEPIEIAIDGFEILGDANKGNYQFILHNAKSNKPWMTNIFARITGKSWTIPSIPQYKDEVDFVASLLGADTPKKIVKKAPKKAVKSTKKVVKKPKKAVKDNNKETVNTVKKPKKTAKDNNGETGNIAKNPKKVVKDHNEATNNVVNNPKKTVKDNNEETINVVKNPEKVVEDNNEETVNVVKDPKKVVKDNNEEIEEVAINKTEETDKSKIN